MITIEDALRNYLCDLAIRQSTQTVETYAQGTQRFKEYLLAQQVPLTSPASVISSKALGYAKWLSENYSGKKGHLAKTTLRTYLSSVSRFYTYLLRERVIDLSVADMQEIRDSFRRVKPQPKKPRLDSARLRNIAMLEALRASGMRVGELVGLKRDDLDYRNHTARVTGKGDKQRVVYFDDTAWNAIQTYLKARNDGARGRALYQLPLFARHDRRVSTKVLPMTTDGVRLVFNELARAASIEIVMTPHSLRHAFATKLLEATGDLAVVQDMLGHASPATTRVYAKVSSMRMRDAHRTAFGYRGTDSATEETENAEKGTKESL